MKRGKSPTLYEKVLLKAHGHNPCDYLRVKRENKKYTFVNRNTKETLVIEDCKKK